MQSVLGNLRHCHSGGGKNAEKETQKRQPGNERKLTQKVMKHGKNVNDFSRKEKCYSVAAAIQNMVQCEV